MKMTLVKIEEAAQAVGVNKKTLIRWEEQGYVHHVKKVNGVRYYSMENIAQLIDLKRGPITYHLQMANYGELPNTICIHGWITYDDGTAKLIPLEGTTIEDLKIPGSAMSSVKYRKRNINIEQYNIKCNKPLKVNYLLHWDESHQGPIICSSNYEKNKFIKLRESKSCDGTLLMHDFWLSDERYLRDPDNTQSIPPKSLIGIESKKTNEEYFANYVLYERFDGHEWLADEMQESNETTLN